MPVTSLTQAERVRQRFELRFPVHLTFYSDAVLSELDGISVNISTGGLLVDCPSWIQPHTEINFVMTLSGHRLGTIKIKGEGVVLRVERSRAQPEFSIAIDCKKSMPQIESYLSSGSRAFIVRRLPVGGNCSGVIPR